MDTQVRGFGSFGEAPQLFEDRESGLGNVGGRLPVEGDPIRKPRSRFVRLRIQIRSNGMARVMHGTEVSPDRLFGAADVLLLAISSPGGFGTSVPMYDGPPRIGGTLPPNVFTCEEFIEAMGMLIRMGVLPAEKTADRGMRPSVGRFRPRTCG